MDSEWYDTILWMVWIVWTIFGAQAVTRWPRFARVMNRLQRAWLNQDDISSAIYRQTDQIKTRIFGSREEPDARQVEEVMRRAESRSWVSREQVVENSRWMEENPNLPNEILRSSWLEELTTQQMRIVEYVHNNISRWVYQNNQEDIMRMTRELKEAGISQQQRRALMENGILWEAKLSRAEQLASWSVPGLRVWEDIRPWEVPFYEFRRIADAELDVINDNSRNLNNLLEGIDIKDRHLVEIANSRANEYIQTRLWNLNNLLEFLIRHPWDNASSKGRLIDEWYRSLLDQIRNNSDKIKLSPASNELWRNVATKVNQLKK